MNNTPPLSGADRVARLLGKLCKFQISKVNIYFTFQRRQRRPAALYPSSSPASSGSIAPLSRLTFVKFSYRALSLADVWDLLIVLQISPPVTAKKCDPNESGIPKVRCSVYLPIGREEVEEQEHVASA